MVAPLLLALAPVAMKVVGKMMQNGNTAQNPPNAFATLAQNNQPQQTGGGGNLLQSLLGAFTS